MGALQTLLTVFPLALASGVNLYATVLVVGLCSRFGWIEDLPGGLDVLGSIPVLVTAGLLYILEFVADKIPVLDNIWDLIHTPIRPLGAAAVALIAVTGASSPLAVAVVLVAGGVALISHGGKAGTRVATNISNPASAATNPITSVIEDVSVAGLAFLALKYPVPAAIIAAIVLILIVVFVPLLLRWALFTAQAFFARLKGSMWTIEEPDPLPGDHRALLGGEEVRLSSRCKSQGIRRANGRSGFLSIQGARLQFTYNRWFRSRLWSLDLKRRIAARLHRRFLIDILEIVYTDEKSKNRVARFVFTKDRSAHAERFLALLESESGAAT